MRSTQHKQMIVCAANVIDVSKDDIYLETLVLPDTCHFGRNMQSIMKFLKAEGYTVKANKEFDDDRGQGFLSEGGEYHGRSEAYNIAYESGQPLNQGYTLPNKKLDSSCIRHFPSTTEIRDFCKL